jgi:hypothetical protein
VRLKRPEELMVGYRILSLRIRIDHIEEGKELLDV